MKHATGAMGRSRDPMSPLSRYICFDLVEEGDYPGPEARHNFPICADWRSFFSWKPLWPEKHAHWPPKFAKLQQQALCFVRDSTRSERWRIQPEAIAKDNGPAGQNREQEWVSLEYGTGAYRPFNPDLSIARFNPGKRSDPLHEFSHQCCTAVNRRGICG